MQKATSVVSSPSSPHDRPNLAYEMDEIRRHFGRHMDFTPKILKVGSGRRSATGSRLHDDHYRFRLHGLDIDPVGCGIFAEQEWTGGAVVGDTGRMPFNEGAYDVPVSHCMLEHLEDCRKAQKEMSWVVANNGLMVLASPNPATPGSLVTRLTPHKFHVFFRRIIQNLPEAAKVTFPTFFSFGSGENVVRWLRNDGFSGVKAVFFADTYFRFLATRLMGRLLLLRCKTLTRNGFERLAVWGCCHGTESIQVNPETHTMSNPAPTR